MDALSELNHQLKYGTTAASLDVEDKARVASVLAGLAASLTKRTADFNKRVAKKAVAAAVEASAEVVLATYQQLYLGQRRNVKKSKRMKCFSPWQTHSGHTAIQPKIRNIANMRLVFTKNSLPKKLNRTRPRSSN